MRKIHECRIAHCSEAPFQNGLCKEHYEEQRDKQVRRNAAIDVLHRGIIDGRLPEKQELREELTRVCKWWDRACRAVNFNSKDELLGDEASYALEWCIAIAQEIFDEELTFRHRSIGNSLSKEIRRSFWERFENLEAGNMSNGIPKAKNE